MPPLFLGLTSLPNSLPPLSERHRGTGMGVAVSSAHIFPAASSSSGGDSSHSSPAPTWSSLQQETALHKLLQHELLPQAAALHELPQHGSFPWGAVLQEQAAPAWVPHRVTSPASKPALAWAPLSMRPQVLPGTCSGVGFSTGCRWISAPPWTFMGCRATACLIMIFTTGCRGISAPAPGAPPPPPSSLTLVSAELFLSHILTPLSSCCCCCASTFSLS